MTGVILHKVVEDYLSVKKAFKVTSGEVSKQAT